MALFLAEFSNKASKYIKKLSKEWKIRLGQKINQLESDPFPQEVERVDGYKEEKVFRIRVGGHRILYIVRYNPQKLIIVKIDKRERVYD